MGKTVRLGLVYGPRPTASGRTQDLGHSFFRYGPPRPVNNIYLCKKALFSGIELIYEFLRTMHNAYS